jgi:hypothetical protein
MSGADTQADVLSAQRISLQGTPEEVAMRLAVMLAMPSVLVCHPLDADGRMQFWATLVACISGMAEQSIGHTATKQVLAHVAGLKPAMPDVCARH